MTGNVESINSVYKSVLVAVTRPCFDLQRLQKGLREIKDDNTWHNLISLADNNGSILFLDDAVKEMLRIGGCLPAHWVDSLRAIASDRSLSTRVRMKAACALSKDLAGRGIRHAILKGPWTRTILYNNEKRQFGDIDILVERSNLSLLGDILTGRGYVCGKYDNAKGEIISVTEVKRRQSVLFLNHCYPYAIIDKVTRKTPIVIVVEPHFDISWSGRNCRRIPPIPVSKLLAETTRAESEFGTLYGLNILWTTIVAAISVYKDAKSLINIRKKKDCKIGKLSDVRELVARIDENTRKQLWVLADHYDFSIMLELAAKYVNIIYDDPLLWNCRPFNYIERCDINCFADAEGFDDGKGPRRWKTLLDERYFAADRWDPERWEILSRSAVHG